MLKSKRWGGFGGMQRYSVDLALSRSRAYSGKACPKRYFVKISTYPVKIFYTAASDMI